MRIIKCLMLCEYNDNWEGPAPAGWRSIGVIEKKTYFWQAPGYVYAKSIRNERGVK